MDNREHDCFLHRRGEEALTGDRGFMGTTHALSGLAFFLTMAWLLPDTVHWFLGSSALIVLVLSCLNLVGGSLAVDLDNTASTAKSSLGILGVVLSGIFRSTSVVVQTMVRSPRDSKEPNPHRGFYHTVPGALLIGGIVFLLTSLPGGVTLPVVGHLSLGGAFALLFTWLNLHMALAGLARGTMRKIRKGAGGAGELLAFVLSLSIAALLFSNLPAGLNFWWVGASMAMGMVVHSFGDCFTTAGSPILFPLPIKGKLWWTIRFLPIKAGGVVEQYIFMPFFAAVSVVAVVIMAYTSL